MILQILSTRNRQNFPVIWFQASDSDGFSGFQSSTGLRPNVPGPVRMPGWRGWWGPYRPAKAPKLSPLSGFKGSSRLILWLWLSHFWGGQFLDICLVGLTFDFQDPQLEEICFVTFCWMIRWDVSINSRRLKHSTCGFGPPPWSYRNFDFPSYQPSSVV